MSFSWVPFYREVAERVLDYEDRQDELLAILHEAKESGFSPVLLTDKNAQGDVIKLTEIDPFTFFASWNRGNTDFNRRGICELLKQKWDLISDVPLDFDGIPTVHPQSSWFFAYQHKRKPDDIQKIWRFVRAAIESDVEDIAPDIWREVLGIRNVGVANLTMGLFWLAPEKFIAFDAHTVEFVRNAGVPIERADLDKKKLTLARYGEILNKIHQKIGSDNLKISLDAYGGGETVMFTWIPFYREVAARVLEYENRQSELLDLLREMKSAGLPTVPLEHDQPVLTPIEQIDPFTFMANMGRTLEPSRLQICAWIRDKWNIEAPVPTDFAGCVAVQSNYRGSWFFGELEGQSSGDNERLWQLAKQAYDGDVRALDATLFAQCLERPNLRMRKLTFGLSWINPEEFLPVRSSILRYIQARGIEFDRRSVLSGGLGEYEELMNRVRQLNPDLVAFVAQTQETGENMFTWVPFYREVAERVIDYENRQSELVKVLREIEADGVQTMYLVENQADGEMTELDAMDPFTFLANFSRTGDDKAAGACRALREKWDLVKSTPIDFDGRAKVSPIHPWFFSSVGDGRAPDDIARLWELARAVLEEGNNAELDAALFARCLKIRGVGAGKLTTGLFWLDSTSYLPVTSHNVSYLEKQGVTCNRKLLEKGDYAEYQSWLGAAREFNDDFLDISHQAWISRGDAPADEDEKEGIIANEMPDFPLNQILYGPPGTGKTYSTIERAVEIIDGTTAANHETAKARFEELRANGQIEFVTFHQSFSYEEFIEGLRPILDEDGNGQARYEVRDGVLKTLALRALGAALEKKDVKRATFENVWEIFSENVDENPDWKMDGLYKTQQYEISIEGKKIVADNITNDKMVSYPINRSLVEKAWLGLLNMEGKDVRSKHVYEVTQVGTHPSVVAAFVRELKRIEQEIDFVQPPQNATLTNSLYAAQSFLDTSPDYSANFDVAPRHVLIVDEINRGNISKILGELITLLEPDKRIGADNELRVQLPVSGDYFALPPNLYLLGTMNTADKSLALLDIALRRRFDFIEMAPDSSLFPDFAADVLTQLNWRLEVALDREHRIGHAYFMKCDDKDEFNAVFRAKIIPLLQEFFYNDWETLRAVLGEGGDKGGAFIKKLAAPAGMKARTKWRWWFDENGATGFDYLEVLRENYGSV